MYKTSLIIGAFFGLSIALTKFLEAWISQAEKDKLKNKLEAIWLRIEDTKPSKIL
jgi:hypothetical protein